MRVSCICPTFRRVEKKKHLLEEAIESFLRQDYPDKELVVFNDCPGQTLCFDHTDVLIFNLNERFSTLGDKYNAAILASTGEAIMNWEDDDISLPNRISRSVCALSAYDYMNPLGYWFLDTAGLHHDHSIGYSHNCSIFTRKAFEAVGGYPATSGQQDAQMDGLLRAACRRGELKLSPIRITRQPWNWHYIYRWGVSDLHLSAYADTQQKWDDYGRGAAQGTFTLSPHWQTDYVQMVQQYLEKKLPSSHKQPCHA